MSENKEKYDEEMASIKAKHLEEVTYWKEKYNETLKELEVLKLKWSVVEMIFKK